MTVTDSIAIPEIPDPPVLPPISITVGCVRVATVYTWTSAIYALRRMINDAYMPNGRLTFLPLRPDLQRHMDHELDQVTAGPVDGMIVASGPWSWGDSVRSAREGDHGLEAGNLAILRDVPNGHQNAWTISVKCKIIAITGDSHRVTVRVTDRSAIQFTPGEIVTVDASRTRRRSNGGR
jgi:hypothetical protein